MRSLAPTLLLLCACSSNPRLAVPPELSDGDAVVFYVAVEDEDPVLFAAEVAGEDLVVPIDLEPGQRVETELAIYDDRPLAELQLEPGLVTFETEGSPLPEPAAHYALTMEGPPEGAPFSPLAWSNSRLSEARFSRSFLACLESRRCLTEEGLCVPCSGPEGVVAPMAPEPVQVTCPDGWAVTTLAQEPPVRICDPRIELDRLACPTGEVRKLGSDVCTPVGRLCPTAGRFAEGVSGLFVDPTAPAGGDGTLAAPFRSIDDAFVVADGSAPILLSVGRHTFAARTSLADAGTSAAPITLRGACASETTIAGGFDVTRTHLRFEDLAIDTDRMFYVGADGSVAFEGVALESTSTFMPITQTGGEVSARDVVADAAGGFIAGSGATVTVEDAVVRAVGDRIIDTAGGPATHVRDVAFIGGRRERPLVWTDQVATVTIQRVAFEDAGWTAVHIDGGDGALVEDVFYRTELGTRFSSVYAIVAHRIRATLRRVWVHGALGMFHLTAALDVTDVVVHPDSPGTVQGRPAAVWIADDSTGAVRRMVVYEARRLGVQLDASNVEWSDLRVHGVRLEEGADPSSLADGVIGVSITGEPEAKFARVIIEDVEGVALAQVTLVASIGRALEIADLDVRDAGPTSCFAAIGGLFGGATNYDLSRIRFTDVRGAAIGMDLIGVGGLAIPTMVARDVTVARSVRVPGCDPLEGAIVVAEGAELVLQDFDVGFVAAPAIALRPSSVNAVDLTKLAARSGIIHDVPVGVRYQNVEVRLDELVDVLIDPLPDGVAIEVR